MSNLLSRGQRAGIVVGVELRLVIIVFAFLATVGGLLLAALLPSYVVMRTSAAALSVTQAASTTDQTQTVTDTQALIAQLATVAGTSSPAQLAAETIAARPKGVTISRVTYTRGSPSTLVVVGVAARREDVNAYKSTLAQNPVFSSVTVPINALVGVDDGAFTLTASGGF